MGKKKEEPGPSLFDISGEAGYPPAIAAAIAVRLVNETADDEQVRKDDEQVRKDEGKTHRAKLGAPRVRIPRVTRAGKTIWERFWEYDARHPEVYILIVKYARELKARGHILYSMDAILHRIRWHYQAEKDVIEEFKMINDFTSRYARVVMEREPDLEGFFKLHKLLRE